MTNLDRRTGFSLVELMVAIAIGGILLALAIPNFQQWVNNARIRTTAEAITNGLQLARSEAVRRNANVQFVLGTGSNWVVGCETAIATDSNGDGLADCPATIQQRISSEGSTGIDLAVTPDGATTVVFNGFGRVQTGVAYNPITQVDVPANPAGLHPFRVLVSGGTIRMCDPTASTGDPRAC